MTDKRHVFEELAAEEQAEAPRPLRLFSITHSCGDCGALWRDGENHECADGSAEAALTPCKHVKRLAGEGTDGAVTVQAWKCAECGVTMLGSKPADGQFVDSAPSPHEPGAEP